MTIVLVAAAESVWLISTTAVSDTDPAASAVSVPVVLS
jgi:hypothetical protein